MPAELRVETAQGGINGIPGELIEGQEIAFTLIVHPPRGTRVLTNEVWIRLWCEAPPPVSIKNIRLQRIGPKLQDIREKWGERSQDEGYEAPVAEARYATQFLPETPYLLSNDQREYTEGHEQIGPWLVIQWEIGDRCSVGPQIATYRILVDEY